jgi:hypothetical protein
METLIDFLKIVAVISVILISALMIVYEFTLGVWANTCNCRKPDLRRGIDGQDYCYKCEKEVF